VIQKANRSCLSCFLLPPRFVFTALILLFLPSCIPKLQKFSCGENLLQQEVRSSRPRVFIGYPKSCFVFDNVGPLLKRGLDDRFAFVGYNVVDCGVGSFVMDIEVKKLSPKSKFLSQDMLLFNAFFELEIECKFCNFSGVAIARKVFDFSFLFSSPKNPAMRLAFLNSKIEKLMKQESYKIERYFRPFIVKVCCENGKI
jgi:hypothetical protein